MGTLLDSYQTYFRDLWPILAGMSHRGIPINSERREQLRELIEREGLRVDNEVQALIPAEVLSTKQKNGYKIPPILECPDCGYKGGQDHFCTADGVFTQVPYETLAESLGLVLRAITIEGAEEKCYCSKKLRPGCGICKGIGIIPAGTVQMRWATPVAFNPNSKVQVIRFMRYLKHPVPKHAKRVDTSGEAGDTTEVKELERLYAKTKHPIYPLLIKKRQLTKMKGTYYEGYEPWPDGKIHTTYTYQTATWQLSSRQPNVQNSPVRGHTEFQKALIKSFNQMMVSSPEHMLVNFDYKSFHAQTTACEAGLPDYLRLAKIDIHSFTACHFIKHPERFNLLKQSDSDLKAFFKSCRRDPRIWTNNLTFEEIRNGKTKSAGLGIGFGMGPKKLYMLYKEDFDSQREAELIWRLIMCDLFPGLAKWHEAIKARAAEFKQLISRFGAIRHFYDVHHWDRGRQKFIGGEQAEAAIAFLPASNAFGMIRWGMLKLAELGMLERFRLINSTHDSLKFDCPNSLVEECVATVAPIMQLPCSKMIYPGVTGPEGLSVEVDAQIGGCNADLH